MNRMRLVFATGALLLIYASPSVGANGGTIGLFADVQSLDCNIRDDAPAMLAVHVVHFAPQGATAVEFSAPRPACMTGVTYLSDTVPFFQIGNSQTGSAVPYGACLTQAHIMTINYFGSGMSEICCVYPVLPHPESGLNAVDCATNVVPAAGALAVVNPDPTCECQSIIPAKETTWGKIKAMYVD